MQSLLHNLRLNAVEGKVGLEVEVEGEGIVLSTEHLPQWRSESDGSLKAAEAREFVLRQPIDLKDVDATVRQLYNSNLRRGDGVLDSIRAGVHVHLNVQQFNPVQLATALVSYYLIEPILTTYCGEGRQGSLFCLRLKDAEFPIHYLNDAYSDKRLRNLGTDLLRYAAVNLKAVAQYGSLEFRALKTPKDYKRIVDWVDMLHNVVFRSVEMFRNPIEVVCALSEMAPIGFLETLVGQRHMANLDLGNLDQEVYDMVDIVQAFAFGHSWEEKKAPSLNIFGTQSEEDW